MSSSRRTRHPWNLAPCRSHADPPPPRHGWGCKPIPEKAVFYLSAAAKNAADVESLALQAGLKKGGAAKGELVLAIFELANCFRQGWGINKDPIAAKQVCDYLVRRARSRRGSLYAWSETKHGAPRDNECHGGIWACKHVGVSGSHG